MCAFWESQKARAVVIQKRVLSEGGRTESVSDREPGFKKKNPFVLPCCGVELSSNDCRGVDYW